MCENINKLKVTTTRECPTLSCSVLALLTLPHSPGWFWVGTFLFRTRLYSLRLPMGIMLIASLLNLPDKKGLMSSCFRIENPFISKRISPIIIKNALNLNTCNIILGVIINLFCGSSSQCSRILKILLVCVISFSMREKKFLWYRYTIFLLKK